MAILAQYESTDKHANRRGAVRHRLRLAVPGLTSESSAAQVVIHDLSVTGMLIESAVGLSDGETLRVEIPDSKSVTATIVWSSGQFHGCQFKTRIPKAAMSAALLRSPFDLEDRASAVVFDKQERAEESHAQIEPASGISFANKMRIVIAASAVLWVGIALLMSAILS